MKLLQTNVPGIRKWILGALGCGVLALTGAQASPITIINYSFEDPAMPDVWNTTFDGVHGYSSEGVPGWYSNEPSIGGAIRYDIRYPGRTGNNVMYLHGSGNQNFYTANFDLGVELQSYSTYTLTFDALSWWWVWNDEEKSPITDGYITFRLGVYTGDDYESRVALAEWAGDLWMLENGTLLPKVTMTLTFTTEEVAPGTKFWIGGDLYGNNSDYHRPTFDNFQLTVVPEPSVAALLGLGLLTGLRRHRRLRREGQLV
jgi:PEP-CTERM putative exosortase interaction domain